jgi:pyruvate-formate lyase
MVKTEESKKLEFKGGRWQEAVDVKDFVKQNVGPYYGNSEFLAEATERTKKIWDLCLEAMKEERKNNGCRAIDTERISTIASHPAGYIQKELEVIVGLQTDQLLQRAMKPFGGMRVVEGAVKERGLEVNPEVKNVFRYTKDQNSGVFAAYDPEIRAFRSKGIHTALDSNGRLLNDEVKALLDETDLLLFDVKHFNPRWHQKLTKVSNENVFKVARYREESGKPKLLRYVLVPGWSDQEERLYELGQFFRDYEQIEMIEIQPYHMLGVHKWGEALGMEYQLKGVEPPTQEQIENTKNIFARYFNKVKVN